MKQFLASALVVGTLSLGLVGCGEKTSMTKETKVTTPGGTTTVTDKKDVKQTGDNPPPVKN